MASERKVDAAERQRQALELRKAGYDYRTIADRLGFKGASGAHKAVQTALRRTLQEPAVEVREMEVARLDALLKGLWRSAAKGNTGAVDRVLRVMERRAALLGLDAPRRSEVAGKGGGPVAVDVAQRPDLSALSDEELEVLAAMAAKAGVAPGVGETD